ncbi:MAG: hypothetical protein JJ714_00160, partial [Acidithiobacillus sp.]|nr:hypothetical protein [Acidithiobacillus sp.]
MPAILDIFGQAIYAYQGPNSFGPHLYHWVQQELSEFKVIPGTAPAHGELQPFTVSPLAVNESPIFLSHLDLAAGTPCGFRITTLNQVCDDVLGDLATRLAGNSIELESLGVTQITVKISDRVSYEDLWNRATKANSDSIRMRFHTPTVFRDQHRLLPFPLPSLVL